MAADRMTKNDHPTALGAFKPVDHVVIATADDERADAIARELRGKGFEDRDILEYRAAETENEMSRMLQHTSEFAGFGHEVTLMRRFKKLADEGASWLIVYAPDADKTTLVGDAARNHGALLAEKYNTLVIEHLI